MPIDTYALCPGGTGKKIKFCCPDFLSELQKIDRMLEGEQHLGCLQHIEELLKQHPDRACLLATKLMLLRATDNLEEARTTSAAFLEKHPDNTLALAEAAIVAAVVEGGRNAAGALHRALAVAEGGIHSRVYEAMGVVARALLNDGEWLAARALLQLQIAVANEDQTPLSVLVELNQSPRVPLLIKDDSRLGTCPDDAPWKDRFQEALDRVQGGMWQAACEKMATLADDVDDAPEIWRCLAALRSWLADRAGSIEAWRKYASLDVPLEDAVEAEALAMLLSDDPLGDLTEIISGRWEIKDFEQLQAGLSLDRRALQIPFDPASLGDENNPPPQAAYLLVDRPILETSDEVTLESVARFLGQAMLYGRQTDREARLEIVGVAAEDLPKLEELLSEMAGDALAEDFQQEVMGKVSASHELLERKWRPPQDTTPEQLEALATEHQRDALLNRWPELKLEILDGKSPREAASEGSNHVRLLAAVMLLEHWNDGSPVEFDFNDLRNELGLATLDPIDPEQTPIETLPTVRLSRVMVEKASDEALLLGYRRAVAFAARSALQKFAGAVVDRPSLAGKDEQLRAYRQLAQMQEDPQQALKYLELGRTAGKSAGQSCAPWDMLELSFRFAQGHGEEAMQLIGHLQTDHLREPGVGEALTRLLIQVGVLRPDGTPAGPPVEPDGSVIVSPDQPAPQTGQVWTPGSRQPGGEKKLWTPD